MSTPRFAARRVCPLTQPGCSWGGCAGVDCCGTATGCASCCFHLTPSPDPCVYTTNHSVGVYRTTDLSSWEYMGEALPNSAFKPGIEFRPHVVFNAATKKFVMWYIDRWDGQSGYSVATSDVPQGPFTTVEGTVKMAVRGAAASAAPTVLTGALSAQTQDKWGDFDIFVDSDGQAYHVRTGFVVEQLTEDYMGVTGKYYKFSTPKPSEGPVFFKRGDLYYILPGTGCCACKGGSTMYVFTSTNPMGPYAYRGEVASNQTAAFDPHSPYNYVTRAQASAMIVVPGDAPVGDTSATYLWMGNQWVSNPDPVWPARNNDLLYFYPLEFEVNGNITHLEHVSSVTIDVPTVWE